MLGPSRGLPLRLGKFTTKSLFWQYNGINSLCLIKKTFSVKLPVQARIQKLLSGGGCTTLRKF